VHITHIEVTMTAQRDTEVLICGAGAAGLILALELARRNIAFCLIEKLPRPFQGSRGKGIQARTQEIFEDLGVLDRIAARGGRYPPERKYADDGSFVDAEITEVVAASPAEPYRLPLMIPQFSTEAVLRERLLEWGQRPEFGCELMAFEQHTDAITARVSDERGECTVRARWLVGADGGRSFVRRALGIDFLGKTLGVRAIVADVQLTGLERGNWHRFGDGDMTRQLAIAPLAGTNMFQIQAPVPFDEEVDFSVDGLNALVAARTRRDDILVESVSWSSAYEMNARLADRYRVGNVFLIGDAAHVHPPTGGQGLNTSVQDAYNLAWKLAAVAKGAPDALLDSYEAERRPVAASVLGLATKLLDALKQGDMRRGREVSQLDVGYGGSSLGLTRPLRSNGILPGDRAPDALLIGAGGQRRRLFALLQGSHWTLLGYEMPDMDRHGAAPARLTPRPGLHIHYVGSNGDFQDIDGQFVDAYAPAPGDWILIRPDGYIGAIVASSEGAALDDYLVQVGLRALPMI